MDRVRLRDTDDLNASSASTSVGDPSFCESRLFGTGRRLTRIFQKRQSWVRKRDRPDIQNERELTAGSVQVWLDLPDDIKYDPALDNFKRLYEQQRGRADAAPEPPEEDSASCAHKLSPVSEHSLTQSIGHDSDYKKPAEETDTKGSTASAKKIVLSACRWLKLAGLVASWSLLVAALLLNSEREQVVLHSAVAPGQLKVCELETVDVNHSRVLLELKGPFAPVEGANLTKTHLLSVWLHIHSDNGDGDYASHQNSTEWQIELVPDEEIDFSPSETRTKYLKIENKPGLRRLANGTRVSLRMSATSEAVVPLTVSYQTDPFDSTEALIYAAALLFTLYFLIIFEVVNRTLAALLSSSLGVAVLALGGGRPTLPELVSWLDVETLLLLFSMMLLVAILGETGMFDYLAMVAFEVTGGSTWPLINCLCFFTVVLSTCLDNVTTVLLMTPVTIRLCEVMQLNPVPVLMSMVIFSNVGGTATPVGDPPNVIIASHPAVIAEGVNFVTFSLHMGVGVVFVCVQTYLQLRFMYRDINTLRSGTGASGHIQELRREIAVWCRAAASLSSYSRDEELVRKALQKKVDKLNKVLERREAGQATGDSDPVYCATLAQMKEKYCIRDRPLLIKTGICLTFVVVVFFLHAIPVLQRLSLGWTALLGALLLLLLSEREDIEPVLARVEWSTLLFFAALFVLMEVLTKLGLIEWIGRLTESVILSVGEEARLAAAIMLVLWVSGLASAFVDNIPLTTMMIRITTALGAGPLGLPLPPLVWALSFGACLGGNGTLIGASANVVTAGVAEQHGYRFTFLQFLKVGFPIMLGNLTVASAYMLLAHCVLTWH